MVDVVVRLSGTAGAGERRAGGDPLPRRRLGREHRRLARGGRGRGDARGPRRRRRARARGGGGAARRPAWTSRVALDPDRPTGTCLVLIDPGGERTMAPDAGANDGLAADGPARRAARGGRAPARGRLRAAARGVAAGGAGGDRAGARARARRVGRPVVVRAPGCRSSSTSPTAPACSLPNASEAHALTGDSDPEAAARDAGGALRRGGGDARSRRRAVDRRRRRCCGRRRSRWTGGGQHRSGRRVRGRLPRGARERGAVARREALAAGCRLAGASGEGPAGARP